LSSSPPLSIRNLGAASSSNEIGSGAAEE
jgi:hypothetical protein